MPHLSPSRIWQTSTSTGTGNITLGPAIAGYRSLTDVGAAAGDTAYMLIEAVDANGLATGQFEIALCTAVSASEWARTTLITRATGFDGNFAAGAKRVSVVLPGQRVGRTRISIFAVPGGTLTLLPETLAVEYVLIGAGGGGGSGRRHPTTAIRGGGGGGGGGGMSRGYLDPTIISAGLTVVVGAASTVRAPAPTADNLNGNPGVDGGATRIEHSGTVLAIAGGGRGGAAGAGGSAGGVGGSGVSPGGNGASANTAAAASAGGSAASGGGGAGGSASTSNVAFSGSAGGQGPTGAPGTFGAALGDPGANATAGLAGVWLGGSGGGGGAASTTAGGGQGGDGGFPGGGGGGSGAGINGFTGGAGGLGADGLAVIIEHF